VAAGTILVGQNWMRGQAWDAYDVILVVVRCLAGVLGLGVGWWWWWRAPANPSGRLLYLAAAADWLFLIGHCWPRSRWAADLPWIGVLTEPVIVIVLLAWPTGRPSRRLVGAVACWTLAGVALVLTGAVFTRQTDPSPDWPDPVEAVFDIPAVWRVLDPVQALATQALPAAIVLVLLIRRQRAVPPAIRPLISPITAAGVSASAPLVVLHLGWQVFGPLISEGTALSVWEFLTLLGPYFMVGSVALGVLVAARRRRRAVSLGRRRREVDLQSAPAVLTPSAAVAAVIGDPTAVVRYRRPDDSWIDADGAALPEVAADRLLLPVLDETGAVTAGLEVDAATPLSPLLTDLATSTIAARSANERATAIAGARRAEVRLRSRELVTAADESRHRLERDLHDGAQQLLVGLALSAGLAARRGEPTPQTLIRQIVEVRDQILEFVDQATPAALAHGLARGLHSLAAVSPIPVLVEAEGDLSRDDPLALCLYLAASEAITNAVKHSGASLIRLRLRVGPATANLRISDDGVGGLREVPHGIVQRLGALDGSARLAPGPQGGTALELQVDRADAAGVGA
jgi:signal transduction histidine kinase